MTWAQIAKAAAPQPTKRPQSAWSRPDAAAQCGVPSPIKAACFELSRSAASFKPTHDTATAVSSPAAPSYEEVVTEAVLMARKVLSQCYQASPTAPAPPEEEWVTVDNASRAGKRKDRGVVADSTASASTGKRTQTQRRWRVMTDVKPAEKDGMSKEAFQGKMKEIGCCNSLASFEQQFGKRFDSLRHGYSGIRVFRPEVQPVWEDPANKGKSAGKWTMVLPDETRSKAAFRAVLAELVGQGLEGVNGVISQCRRSTHVLLLWTKAHDGNDKDPFGIQALASRVSERVGMPVRATFKPHVKQTKPSGKNSRKEHRIEVNGDSDYESSPMQGGTVGSADVPILQLNAAA